MRRLVAALLISLLASCGGGGELPIEDVPVVPVRAAWYAEWPVRSYVIRSQDDWEAAWAEVKSIGNPPPPLPAVDFTQSAVVGASIGWTGNACTVFRIHQIQRRGTDYQVEYGFGEPPPPNTGCVAIVVPAYEFALVPVPVGNVTFERRDL